MSLVFRVTFPSKAWKDGYACFMQCVSFNENAVLGSYRDQAQTSKLVIARKVYIESIRPVVRASEWWISCTRVFTIKDVPERMSLFICSIRHKIYALPRALFAGACHWLPVHSRREQNRLGHKQICQMYNVLWVFGKVIIRQ